MRQRFADVDEAFAYFESFTNLERSPTVRREYRLERMHALLEAFGRPERVPEAIHIVGSKGKGSTAAFIASILEAAGYDVGLYTSPHVETYLERFTSSGRPLPEHVLTEEAERIRAYVDGGGGRRFEAETHGGPPTTFELLTLLAFLAFERLEYRYVVLEAGMGGRLDATNVVVPRATVITPIEREHTKYLGDTVEEIAAEKAAVIKGAPVFVGRQSPEALAVIHARAADAGSPVRLLAEETTTVELDPSAVPPRLDLRFADGTLLTPRLSMLGTAQGDNAALAALCARTVFPELPRSALERGLQTARLPGRGELLRTARGTPVLLDGAHTPRSVEALKRTFTSLFGRRGVLLFGSVIDKDHGEMAGILADAFERVVVARPGTFKESDPGAVASAFEAHGATVSLIPDAGEALEAALEAASGRPVLVTGSFYLLGAVRRRLSESVDGLTGYFV
ncbi:MAG: bifunctional folylpolyglutamate synthase/dihydrofolate synthase [Spirochaetaceae bacterium]